MDGVRSTCVFALKNVVNATSSTMMPARKCMGNTSSTMNARRSGTTEDAFESSKGLKPGYHISGSQGLKPGAFKLWLRSADFNLYSPPPRKRRRAVKIACASTWGGRLVSSTSALELLLGRARGVAFTLNVKASFETIFSLHWLKG
jgi:hypothetical protein